MCSFGYLKSLPVDYLKIDGNFVRDILEDPLDGEIVLSSDRVASRPRIQTIAEFMENNAIRELLHEIGVDYVQGYGVGQVLPLTGAANDSL
jgi:EAL domain-containing protein (putative c-di-GMP-specific phosphodiesterase class I)